MSEFLIALCILAVSIWLVSRAVSWLPGYYAQEEEAWVSAVRQSSEEGFEPPETRSVVHLWHDFFTGPPKASWLTLIATLAIMVIGLDLWHIWTPGWSMVVWFIFGSVLICLALVDCQTKLLPDVLTIPLVWAGLLVQLFPATASFGLTTAVIGAVLGYMPLWLIAQLFRLVRGREGLGMGDLKLLAVMGAWSGPMILPHVIFLAAFLAILWFVIQKILYRRGGLMKQEHPFGPWIVMAYLLIGFPGTSILS